jgi:hypothetical protein
VGRKVLGGLYADRLITIPVPHVLYAFIGTAVGLGLIDAPFVHVQHFRRSHLYVRTVKGVFFVHSRSLSNLLDRLGAMHFLSLHSGLGVNLHQEMELDLSGKRKRIGVVVNDKETEWLVVSRRQVTMLREVLGLRPPRSTPKEKKNTDKALNIARAQPLQTEFCEKS